MSIHHVYGEEVHFGDNTGEVHDLFQHEHNKHEFERHKSELGAHGETTFSLGGNRYKAVHIEKDGKKMISFERDHHH